MDTFDNLEQPRAETADPQLQEEAAVFPESVSPPEPEQSETQQSQPGIDSGRKKSPYADSPYIVQHPQADSYQPQTQRPPKAPKKPKEKGASHGFRPILAGILTVALVIGGCCITGAVVNARWEKRTAEMGKELNARMDALEAREKAPTPGSAGLPEGTARIPSQIYAENADSVVSITCTISLEDDYGFGEGTGYASGFILREDGYVVTNSHVVEDATSLTVTLNDGTEYEAQVVGADADYEIAVLRIDAENLPAVTLGSSDALCIGDMVVAIGNPLGTLAASQTVGYISGINREIALGDKTINMLQTDTVINSGSSGGALFNTRGQVVGITTAKFSGFTGSGTSIEGISLAVPIDDVRDMLYDLIDYGYVTGAYLGVTVRDVDPYVSAVYGLPMGAYVETVTEDSAADRAGIQPKDIITKLGDNTVESLTDLTRSLRRFRAGDETTVTVVRGGTELVLNITLDEKPAEVFGSQEPEIPDTGDFDEWYDYFYWYFGE